MSADPQVPEISDSEMLERASQGDEAAFGLMYQRYVTRIYNYIYYRTGHVFEAEDLTARVFLRASNHITRYRNMGVPFSAWLYRIAHNLVANWYRDNQRRQEVPLDDSEQSRFKSDHPETTLVQHQEMEKLMKHVRTLPPERQQLIILKFVEDLSNAEIGLIMGRSEGAVKSLYHRTLISLRVELDKGEE
jgi:RNA polymerase sigma-70 factor (ECF subfamily)